MSDNKTRNSQQLRIFRWHEGTKHEYRTFEAIGFLFENDIDKIYFLFDPASPSLRGPPKELISDAGALSSGERLTLLAALDLWSYDGNLNLSDALAIWDVKSWCRFINAICHFKGFSDQVIAFLVAHQQKSSRDRDHFLWTL